MPSNDLTQLLERKAKKHNVDLSAQPENVMAMLRALGEEGLDYKRQLTAFKPTEGGTSWPADFAGKHDG